MDIRKLTGILLVMALVGFVLIVYAFAVGPLATKAPADGNVPLKAWTTTDQALYGPGDVVNVTVHVQNVGTTTGNFSVTPCVAFGFRVVDLQGTPYFDSRNGSTVCALVIHNVSLAPGGEANETFRWDQTTSTGLPIPPGRWYRLVPDVDFPKTAVVESDAALVFLG